MQHLARDVVRVSDQGVDQDDFLSDVLDGPRQGQKEIFSKYFYDERGSQLFDQITGLDEYYPTRTEIEITARFMDEVVAEIGERALLVEYGSGTSEKTRLNRRQEQGTLAGERS